MASSRRKFNIEKLKVLASGLKKLDDNKYRIQVGIFGEKGMRADGDGPTNAEIGVVHEMGSAERGIPRRSFLLDTFTQHGKELEAELAPVTRLFFDKANVDEYLKKATIAATNMVDKAFDTGGWGAWPANSFATVMRKLRRGIKSLKKRKSLVASGSADQVLVDTGQLRAAIAGRIAR